jgi:hypothetical protein
MTALRVGKPSDEEMQQPTMPSYPNAIGEELSRCAYSILDSSERVDRLKDLSLKAAGHNLVPCFPET